MSCAAEGFLAAVGMTLLPFLLILKNRTSAPRSHSCRWRS